MIADPPAFIRAHTALRTVPHAPELRLYVADEATELWSRTEEELGEMGLPPPFWAFAWAGGQALARYLLDHPETVAGRRVLDLASGSGLVAIAAARVGAASAHANDIDPFAFAAIALNAEANGVSITPQPGDLVGMEPHASPAFWAPYDCVLAGDVCYEQGMASRMMTHLRAASAAGRTVLIGNPGRAYLPREGLTQLADYAVPVTRALEDAEVKRTRVWRVEPA